MHSYGSHHSPSCQGPYKVMGCKRLPMKEGLDERMSDLSSHVRRSGEVLHDRRHTAGGGGSCRTAGTSGEHGWGAVAAASMPMVPVHESDIGAQLPLLRCAV